MASPVITFYLSCLLLWNTVQVLGQEVSPTARQEERSFVTFRAGEHLKLQCDYDARIPATIYWFKQSLGQKPDLIFSLQHNDQDSPNDEFKDNPHLKITRKVNATVLTITDLRVSDSATYHCLCSFYRAVKFQVSVTVSVTGSGSSVGGSSLRSGSVQAGGSVSPSCTVHTGSCAGQHNVYWFTSSEESPPGIIYTHGARADQCDAPNKTCVYELPISSLNQSDAGMYYCAVASCGHILLEKETKMNDHQGGVDPWTLVNLLIGALTFTIICSVTLAVSLLKITRRRFSHSTGSRGRPSSSPAVNTEANQDSASLHYAALSINKSNKSRRDGTTSTSCVYSGINVHDDTTVGGGECF